MEEVGIPSIETWTEAQRAVLRQLILRGQQTIAELARDQAVSVPFMTKALNELIASGWVCEVGRKENYARRAPRLYFLNAKRAYFLGIDMGHLWMSLCICDLSGTIIYEHSRMPFYYEDSRACFDNLLKIIQNFLREANCSPQQISCACMTVGGRVTPQAGTAYNIFTTLDEPLADALTQGLAIPTTIDNDTRCMTYGEWLQGCCRGLQRVVFINVSWGIGMGIIIDGKRYAGRSGYAGEMGHVHCYDNDIICHCGKTGCMETETSGAALLRKVMQRLRNGQVSILSNTPENELSLQAILDAIQREDILCIDALQEVATELGRNLAGIINIFNPEMLVIGGELSTTGDYLLRPIQMGIKKYSLNKVSEDSIIALSTLSNQAGLVGACLTARSHYLHIDDYESPHAQRFTHKT